MGFSERTDTTLSWTEYQIVLVFAPYPNLQLHASINVKSRESSTCPQADTWNCREIACWTEQRRDQKASWLQAGISNCIAIACWTEPC